MAIVEMAYTMPTSWDDKEMDWENPDPGYIDYVMSIRLALIERFAVVNESLSVGSRRLHIAPYNPLGVAPKPSDLIVAGIDYSSIQNAIRLLCPYFVNVEATTDSSRDWAVIESDPGSLTINWTWKTLTAEYPDLLAVPSVGSLQSEYQPFLRACKEAINRLHMTTLGRRFSGKTNGGLSMSWTLTVNSGANSAYSSATAAYNSARSEVLKETYKKTYDYTTKSTEGTGYLTDLDNAVEMYHIKDSGGNSTYNCSIGMRTLKFNRLALNPLAGRAVSVVAMIVAVPPAQYDGDAYDTPIFAADGFGFLKGLNIVPLAVDLQTPASMNQSLGSESVVQPMNEASTPSKGEWRMRRSGFDAGVYVFCDHAVNEGFRFCDPILY